MSNEIQLTKEQEDIINTLNSKDKVIKINAVAGSGKSFSLTQIAKKIREKDKNIPIYYFVFNKMMAEEADKKFKEEGLDVLCSTTHSFALKRITAILDGNINIIPALDFNIFMEIKNRPKYNKKWASFKNVKLLFDEYCLCYDKFEDFIDNINIHAKRAKIKGSISKSDIDILKDIYLYLKENNIFTHGSYLKSYACEYNDKIKAPIILVDECQDTNLMFYRILKRMEFDKLYLVGDTKQNIYQFCRTINIFDKFEGKDLKLSKSFRINNYSCDLANRVIKKHYKIENFIENNHNKKDIRDKGKKTILFRLNSTMLEYVVNILNEKEDIKVVFMSTNNSGSISDRFEDCFSDMLYFYYKLLESININKAIEFKNNFRITNNPIVNDYIKIAKESNMGLYHYLRRNPEILSLDFIKYFNLFLLNELNILDVVKKVKNSEDCKNPKKTYFMSTVHRYKGLEAEHVKIAEDKWSISSDGECNLVYIAVSRATRFLEAEPIERLLGEN